MSFDQQGPIILFFSKTSPYTYLFVSDMATETILITGANGYLALHIIQQAITLGWNIVGTVRSEASAAKVKALFPDAGEQLSLVLIPRLEDVASFEQAFKDHAITAVINAASPILSDPKDQKTDVVDPATHGGLALLEAAQRYGGTALRRVIHVGSFTSAMDFALGDAPGHTFGPETWNPITYEQAVSGEHTAGYVGSKVLVERAMWEFMETQRNFDFVSLLPATIFGPHVAAPDLDHLNVSSSLLWELASPSPDPSPWHGRHMGAWVDVRDTASALLRAVEVPEAGGQRFVAGQRTHWQCIRDAARYSDELRNRVEPGTLGDGEAAKATTYDVDGSKVPTNLGVSYTALSVSVRDSFEQLLAIEEARSMKVD